MYRICVYVEYVRDDEDNTRLDRPSLKPIFFWTEGGIEQSIELVLPEKTPSD